MDVQELDDIHELVLRPDAVLLEGDEQVILGCVLGDARIVTLSAQLLRCTGPQLVHGVLTSDSGGPLVSLPLGFKEGPVGVSDAGAQAGPGELLLLATATAPGALACPSSLCEALGVC